MTSLAMVSIYQHIGSVRTEEGVQYDAQGLAVALASTA